MDSVSQPNNNLKHLAVTGALWYGGSRVVIQLISWLVTIVVARLISPGDYGLLGMALMYVGLIEFLNELGLGAAIVQFKEIAAEDLDTIFWFGLSTSTVLYLLTLAMAPSVAQFFHQPALVHLLWVTGLSFLISGLRIVPWTLLTRDVDFKRRSIAESFGRLAGAGITLLLAYRSWGVWALALGFLVPNLVMTAQVYLQSSWRPRWRFCRVSLRRCLGFSANVAGARMAWYLEDNADQFIVGKFLGSQALGFYGFAQRFGTELTGRILSILVQVAFPVYSRIQDETERFKKLFLMSTELVCTLLFPLAIGLFLVADDAIPWLLTAKWMPMIIPLKILCWAVIPKTIHALTGPPVLAKGGAALTFRYHVISLIVLSVSYFVGTRFGLPGVCFVLVTIYPLLVLYWISSSRKMIGYEWQELGRALYPSLAGSAMMLAMVLLAKSLIINLLPPTPLFRVSLIMLTGGISYIGVVLLVSPGILQRTRAYLRRDSTLVSP